LTLIFIFFYGPSSFPLAVESAQKRRKNPFANNSSSTQVPSSNLYSVS
jgi:hypothetical protein